MGAVAMAIGGLTDAISLIQDLNELLFPKPPTSYINSFRVPVGGLGTGKDEEGSGIAGAAPALAAWDLGGHFLGYDEPSGTIHAGSHREYSIAGKDGQPAHYLSVVSGGDDGICIYAVTGETAVPEKTLAWFGDLGRDCGALWYHQDMPVTDRDSDNYYPSCIWLDSNDDGGNIWKGFNLHIPSFLESSDERAKDELEDLGNMWAHNRETLCDSEPRFSMYKNIFIGNTIRVFRKDPTSEKSIHSVEYLNDCINGDNWLWSDYPDVRKIPDRPSSDRTPNVPLPVCASENCPPLGPSFCDWERHYNRLNDNYVNVHERDRNGGSVRLTEAIYHRQKKYTNHLVISHIKQHAASEVCNSPSSLGPDFVSVTEGMFCDMSERQLWLVCTDDVRKDCFDMDTLGLRAGFAANAIIDFGNATSVFKNYTNVKTWKGV